MDQDGQRGSTDAPATEQRPTMVGHVHLKVRDLERAVEFYRDVLGMTVTERQGPFAFLRFGDRHHDVALQSVGENADGPGHGVGLYHAAFEVEDADTLGAIYEDLRAEDVPVSAVDHGISEAIYFTDPDGNGLEVYRDTRAESGNETWNGTNEPFDPLA